MTEQLSTRAYSQIIQMILSHRLPPGAALQEAKLADALDMSRTPVREAMKRIEAEGLAHREGRLLRVRRLDRAEIEEIFLLRQALEGFSARQAVNLPAATLAEMARRVRALMDHGPGEGEEQRQVDNDFHGMIARSSANRTLVQTLDALRLRTCMFDVHQVPDRFAQGCREHLDILAALSAGDATLAETRMAAHIRNACTAILGRLEDLKAESAA
jgi:DNA-binding GntR family transcriptional regulator